jgi:hypothetical protein
MLDVERSMLDIHCIPASAFRLGLRRTLPIPT